MSNDTMPCGCSGHADYEELCRYPALEKELAEEREARKQAERERDEAQVAAGDETSKRKEWQARCERAEADNAALHIVLKDAVFAMNHACDTLNDMDAVDEEEDAESIAACGRVTEAMERMDGGTHPGAALLAEVEALRRFYDAARPFAEATGAKDANIITDEEWALVYAHAAVDALKGTP